MSEHQDILVDEIDSTTTYVGTAGKGSAPDDSVWEIKKITVIGGQTQIRHAKSPRNTSFDQIWDDRATYNYL